MTGTTGTTTENQDGGRSVLAALDALAAARRTGTARLTGERAGRPEATPGALYFRNGRVVGAEVGGSPTCAARLVAAGRLSEGEWDEFAEACAVTGPQPVRPVPAAVGLGPAEWAAICLDAILEAAAELLPVGPGHDLPNSYDDLVLQPDSVPGWTASSCSVAFHDLRQELRRRQSVLDRLQSIVTPDSVLWRATDQWPGPLQISARQWRFVRAVGTGASPREIAERLGAGVFSTTVLAAGLIDLGMLTSGAEERTPDALPVSLFSDAVA